MEYSGHIEYSKGLGHMNTDKIREYLEKFEELAQAEPPMFADEEHDTAPTEEWEAWNADMRALILEYGGDIIKTITEYARQEYEGSEDAVEQMQVNALLRQILEEGETLAITTRPVTALDFPLDKVNSKVWKLFEEPQPNGQMRLAIGVESEEDKRKGKQVDIAYSIDFRELEELENVKITRKLEPFDKRVYIAIGALFDSGQATMSYQQIYKAMGYSKRAGAGALKKIDAAVTKMAGAKIYIDNLQESEEYKSRVHFKYDGPLLMTERITAMVDGQPAECVIRVHRSLVLLDFARERKQFTTIQRRLLDSPISKTNANIQLEDYLIERISHMKNGKAQPRMLFATIYKNADIKTTKQKQRAWPKIQKLLDHYVKCAFIKGYQKDADGVTIEL